MDRQPLTQTGYNGQPVHYYDEDAERRVVSDCGKIAVVWTCKSWVKLAKVYVPRLIDVADNSTIGKVTVCDGKFNIYIRPIPGIRVRVAIAKLPRGTDMVERLFLAHKAATL